ncbi:polyprotein [Plakobranchus ocellatus]|uniref:Polyprotein n=1 Tax=Plakobranchus ocellatus TaxID=259542 RepID=A0AAV4DMM2_9GAST|nr:polyprotein [Plakobranchus ocellatus]
MPLLDDLLHELCESRVFTKVDLRNGFWHVLLDTESSLLTTFQTCYGPYRWLRLPFGLSVSSEIFQRKILELFGALPGVVAIHDDAIIHGRNR